MRNIRLRVTIRCKSTGDLEPGIICDSITTDGLLILLRCSQGVPITKRYSAAYYTIDSVREVIA